jgi:glutaconate CoA-transferase, subunit A
MEVLDQGVNPIFTDPDPDKAREFFRQKSRAMVDKRMTEKEAVEKFVHDGDYFAAGGFGANRIPNSIIHEIVRQRKKNLGFLGHTSTHDFQVLAAGKCFNRCDAAYIVGLEARGLSPNARKYIQSGEVQLTEWSNYALDARLKAAADGVSFGIIRSLLGTDTFKMSAAKVIECPFTGKKYAAVPACWPDVVAIHVHEADMYGNSIIKGISVADMELARAAKHLIISAEKIVSNSVIREDPTHTAIPFYMVDAVVEAPYGSYPGNMAYCYFSDEVHLAQWMKVEKDPEEFAKFLDHYIYSCANFEEYIEKCGGLKRIEELQKLENVVEA